MLTGVFDVLFGCTHKRLSFPRTANPRQRRSQAASITGTYVVCLDCGREFAYDWANMRMVTSRDQAVTKTVDAPADLKVA
jgi:hypothetical protein